MSREDEIRQAEEIDRQRRAQNPSAYEKYYATRPSVTEQTVKRVSAEEAARMKAMSDALRKKP